jgi:hypothetical protein
MKLVFDSTRIVIEYELVHPEEEEVESQIATIPDKNQPPKDPGMQKRIWKKGLWKRLDAYLQTKDQPDKKLQPLSVNNCFALSDREDEAKRYFQALQSDKAVNISERNRFISTITFESGYVAPLYLINGSLNRFDEDWARIHHHYAHENRSLNDWLRILKDKLNLTNNANLEPFKRFRALQMHEFDCWLQWGPSVGICDCEQWGGSNQRIAGSIGIQFGFGDENNSIPLLPAISDLPDEKTRFEDLIKEVFACLDFSEEGRGALAVQRVITARPVWAVSGEIDPELRTFAKNLCAAQKAIFTEDGPETVLDYISHRPPSGAADANCYSAYLWLMFVVCRVDLNGKVEALFPEKEDSPWRGMLPFFEHANIANADVCNSLRRMLATKALQTIQQFVQELDDPVNSKIRFVCVCSVDDTGCDKSPRANVETSNVNGPTTVVGWIQELLSGSTFQVHPRSTEILSSQEQAIDLQNYVIVPKCLNDVLDWSNYSSCHFPELIDRYLTHMKTVTNNANH